jgi:hypothetical protein
VQQNKPVTLHKDGTENDGPVKCVGFSLALKLTRHAEPFGILKHWMGDEWLVIQICG